MKTESQFVYILLERDTEAEDLLNELLNVIGYPANKEKLKDYPRLMELCYILKEGLYND